MISRNLDWTSLSQFTIVFVCMIPYFPSDSHDMSYLIVPVNSLCVCASCSSRVNFSYSTEDFSAIIPPLSRDKSPLFERREVSKRRNISYVHLFMQWRIRDLPPEMIIWKGLFFKSLSFLLILGQKVNSSSLWAGQRNQFLREIPSYKLAAGGPFPSRQVLSHFLLEIILHSLAHVRKRFVGRGERESRNAYQSLKPAHQLLGYSMFGI